MGSSPTAHGIAWKAMDETQEKSSLWGQQPCKHRGAGRLPTEPLVLQGRLAVQPLQCIDSIFPEGRMHTLAEGRETAAQQQPSPGQCCIYLLDSFSSTRPRSCRSVHSKRAVR